MLIIYILIKIYFKDIKKNAVVEVVNFLYKEHYKVGRNFFGKFQIFSLIIILGRIHGKGSASP